MKKYMALFLAFVLALSLWTPVLAAEEAVSAEVPASTEESAPAEAPAPAEEPVPEEEAPEGVSAPEAAREAALREGPAALSVRDGDGGTVTVNYYDSTGSRLLHTEEVRAGGQPHALVGPYDGEELIFWWSTQPDTDLDLEESWDLCCLPAYEVVSEDTDYYAVYSPEWTDTRMAAFYISGSWMGEDADRYFLFDWLLCYEEDDFWPDGDYADRWLRWMIFDVVDDYGTEHELYSRVLWYDNADRSGETLDPAGQAVTEDTVFYGKLMSDEYWMVYFEDADGEILEAYAIEEGGTVAAYPGDDKTVPEGDFWMDREGNVYSAAQIRELAITEDLWLSPTEDPAALSPYEIALSLKGRPASSLKALLGEPLSSEYTEVKFYPTGVGDGSISGELFYDGFVVFTRRTDAQADETVSNVKKTFTVSFYASQDSAEPLCTQQVIGGDDWAFTEENRFVDGRLVESWRDAEDQWVGEITEDTALYPVFAEREENCWQVSFFLDDGQRALIGVAHVPKGEKLSEQDIPREKSGDVICPYVWHTGPHQTGEKIADLTELSISGDICFYGTMTYAGVVQFLTEDGQRLVSWSGGMMRLPGEVIQEGSFGFYPHTSTLTGRGADGVTVLGWKNEEGETVARAVKEKGEYTMEPFEITLTTETQRFYAVEGVGAAYYTKPGTITTHLFTELAEKGECFTQAPTSYDNRPVVGWTAHTEDGTPGEPVDLSQPQTVSRRLDMVLGWYLHIRDPKTGADIRVDAIPHDKPYSVTDLPAEYNGKAITGWYMNGEFCDPSDLPATTIERYLLAWYGLRLPADDGKAYINGMGDNSFAPQESLTRAQAANILYKLLDVSARGDQPCVFTDVKESSWYYEAVTVLASHGIITGYAAEDEQSYYFNPNDSITRAEFVTLLSRLFPERTQGNGVGFNDVNNSSWYRKAVSTASRNGWVTGYVEADGSCWFRPNDSITRAEAVTIMNRVLGRCLTEDQAAAMTMPFADVKESHWAYSQILAAAVQGG